MYILFVFYYNILVFLRLTFSIDLINHKFAHYAWMSKNNNILWISHKFLFFSFSGLGSQAESFALKSWLMIHFDINLSTVCTDFLLFIFIFLFNFSSQILGHNKKEKGLMNMPMKLEPWVVFSIFHTTFFKQNPKQSIFFYFGRMCMVWSSDPKSKKLEGEDLKNLVGFSIEKYALNVDIYIYIFEYRCLQICTTLVSHMDIEIS